MKPNEEDKGNIQAAVPTRILIQTMQWMMTEEQA